MNLLFTGHDFKFLTPVIDFFRNIPGVNVRIEKQRGHVIENIEEAEQNCLWADVVFCEWALDNLLWYSKHKRPGQMLLARLHSQELESVDRFINATNWEKVDHLILICPANHRRMLERFPCIGKKAVTIYNPIPAVVAAGIPKMENSDFNLGFVGIVPERKRFDLCFDIFEKLKERDSRWHLIVKGHKPWDYPWMASRVEEMKFYNSLFERIARSPFANSVVIDKHGSDMLDWYSKIGFIISTSDFEGSHQAVAEGMASGCIPIIRNWLGAGELYPEKFTYGFNASAEETAEFIYSWKKDAARFQETVEECRRFAVEHFDNEQICKKICALIDKHPAWPVQSCVKEAAPENRGDVPQVMILAFMSSNSIDGYRIRVEQMLKRLSALGASMRLLCLHQVLDEARKEALKKANDAIGVPYDLVESPSFFSLAFSEESVAAELAQIEKIIAANNVKYVQAEALYCARFLCFLKRRNTDLFTIFDCHGASPAEEEMGGASPQRVKHSSVWEELVFRQVDGVIFVAKAMKKYYDELYNVDSYKSVVIPCCVERKGEAELPVSRKSDVPEDAPVLGYLGTLAVWQCAKEMFELCKVIHQKSKEVFFYFILPSRDHEECCRYLKKAGIPQSSFKVEEIPHDEVPGALCRLDAGLLLRRDSVVNRVSSPTKFGEYLDAGVPVVLTDCIGDYSSLVIKYSLGEVLPSPEDDQFRSEDKALRIIEMMKRRHNARESFTRKSRRVVADLLAWDANIRILYDFYNKLGENK